MGSLPSVVLPATEVRYISSSFVDQEYKISIGLPHSYANKDTSDKKYPTIYLLDGNYYLGMVTEMTRIMAFCGSNPEAIVVGISYPLNESVEQTEESFKQALGLRSRDLTPVKDKVWEKEQIEAMSLAHIATGGAAQFLEFIKKELIPVVDTEYRTDTSNRILAGHSMSGLFVLYTLFHEPDLFRGLIAASPSLWFGDRSMFPIEDNYAQNQNDLPANLYLSVGQKEEGKEAKMVSNFFRFSAILESRDYSGLTMKNQVFENFDHCEAVVPGFLLGFKWIFSLEKSENGK